jgi:hypothetical protein
MARKRGRKNANKKTQYFLSARRSYTRRRFYNDIRPLLSRDLKPSSRVINSLSRDLAPRPRIVVTRNYKTPVNRLNYRLKNFSYKQDLLLKQKRICRSRKTRREVLFSKNRTGSGNRKPDWKLSSYITCVR